MITICGRCGKVQCVCSETAVARPVDDGRAKGARLDEIASEIGLERAQRETDEVLRARCQMSYILMVPWRSGILAGRLLDKFGNRNGFYRGSGEDDERFRVRMMLKSLPESEHEKVKELM